MLTSLIDIESEIRDNPGVPEIGKALDYFDYFVNSGEYLYENVTASCELLLDIVLCFSDNYSSIDRERAKKALIWLGANWLSNDIGYVDAAISVVSSLDLDEGRSLLKNKLEKCSDMKVRSLIEEYLKNG